MNQQRTIPTLFFTWDRDIELTIFTLATYARYWPTCPLRFLIPINSREAQDALLSRAPPELEIVPIESAPAIVPTLRTLLEQAGAAHWVFWITSDRYPYASLPEALDNVARGVLRGDVPSEIEAVRLTRWRDAGAETAHLKIGGLEFGVAEAGRYGHWHHHFMRTRHFRWFVEDANKNESLRQLAVRVSNNQERQHSPVAIPSRNMVKFEEAMIDGKHTLNFALRQKRAGLAPDLSKIGAATEGYVSRTIPHRNQFWKVRKIDASMLDTPLPSSAFHVVSSGGVGSKMIARWLQPTADRATLLRSHTHRRLPPLAVPPNEPVVYVFGDPRNAVLSLFSRRMERSALHGFKAREDRSPSLGFVLGHARNVEVDVQPMDDSWDLDRFLQGGFDLLRLEEHFDYWAYGDTPYPVLFVRYETFARTAPLVADHLRITRGPVSLVKRQSDWRALPADRQAALQAIYGEFAARLESLPDLFEVPASSRPPSSPVYRPSWI